MHSFKGLEFRCVAVVGAHEGALPFRRGLTPVEADRLQHEADLMAERCLLFVVHAGAGRLVCLVDGEPEYVPP